MEVQQEGETPEAHIVKWGGEDYSLFDLPQLAVKVDRNGLSWAMAEREIQVIGSLYGPRYSWREHEIPDRILCENIEIHHKL